MAIIQISKIQQRSGNLVDLPQLDEAQLGWANDARRMFIGRGQPYDPENIEVLTSYSNISFSQIDGSGGANYNVTTPTNGQLLTYVTSTNTWDNWPSADILSANANFKLNLGDAGNIKMTGGSTGFVLQTDGLGNLSWTNKGVVVSNISAASKANPGVITTATPHYLVDKSYVTITGVNGMTQLNGNSYYANVLTANTFSLYSDSALTTTVDTTGFTTYTNGGQVVSQVGGGASTLVAGGVDTTIQYNSSGTLTGSSTFTLSPSSVLTHTGPYFAVGNVYANSGAVVATQLTGSLMTNAQPNITSTGTLTSLSVTGNANVGNLNTAGNVIASQVTANSNGTGNNFRVGDDAFIGDINVVNTMIVKGQQDGTQGYIVFGNTNTTNYIGRNGSNAITVTGAFSVTGNANVGNIGATNGVFTNVSGNGSSLSSITGANVSGAVAFATTANSVAGANVSGQVGNALVAGTVYTAAQPNITSTGTLASLSVTANVTAGNLVTGGVVSATGNASVLGIKTDNYYYANGVAISFSGTYSNSNVASYLPTFTGTIGAGTATHYGTTLTTGANTTAGTITGNWSLSAGSKLSATYADLAEYYEADAHYEPGTVLAFGGEKEVTIAEDGTTRVAGVVSTDPAYAMNAKCPGIAVAIALQGRVPTKVRGTVRKGDMMVSAGNGFARPWNNPHMGTVIGKALENFDGVEGVIEIAVGRL